MLDGYHLRSDVIVGNFSRTDSMSATCPICHRETKQPFHTCMKPNESKTDEPKFADLKYGGGGYFRDNRIPVGETAYIIHGPELLKKAVQLETELTAARAEVEMLRKLANDRLELYLKTVQERDVLKEDKDILDFLERQAIEGDITNHDDLTGAEIHNISVSFDYPQISDEGDDTIRKAAKAAINKEKPSVFDDMKPHDGPSDFNE